MTLKNKLIGIGIIFLVLIFTAGAFPIPMGIDGVVYDIDNFTRADETVNISFMNIDSGKYIKGNLRPDGSYSVAINGEYGDSVLITIQNEINSVNKTIEVYDSMHGVDLYLELADSGDGSDQGNNKNKTKNNNSNKPEFTPPRKLGKNRSRKVPLVLTGRMDEFTGELMYTIKNTRSNKTITGKVMNDVPVYVELVEADKGDILELEIKNKFHSQRSELIVSEESVLRENIILDKEFNKAALTGSSNIIIKLLFLVFLGILVLIKISKKK